MNKASAIWLQLFITVCAGAQPSDGSTSGPDVAAERSRIQVERAQAETRYVQEQAACYARFAVNDCLRDARARRRQAVDRLRRQEISLNDAERQRRALDQRQKIKDGSAGLPGPHACGYAVLREHSVYCAAPPRGLALLGAARRGG